MNNRKINIIWFGCVLTLLMACNTLDVPPINIVGDKEVFTSESGITAYMARLYGDLPIEDFNTSADNINWIPENNAQDYTFETAKCDPRRSNLNGDNFSYWTYGPIRNMNYFLQEFSKYSSNFPKEKADTWMGEIYFLRAYHYFAMVKRYGGIILVKDVVDPIGKTNEELFLPRNKEAECYDFILSDLDKAIELLPEESPAQGRANKNVAYGLKARIALHAASIAKYGDIQLDGLLGVPAERAKEFYQKAYDAAKAVDGKYSLYNKGGDLAVNYTNVFIDQSSPENMFVRYYHYPEYTHCFELFMVPWQVRGAENFSGRANPTLDFVEMFDDTDGKPFILNTGMDNNPVFYENRVDLFAKAEPRLRGIVIFPGDVFKGEVIDVRKGIVKSGDPITSITSTNSFTDDYNGMTYQGASGMGYNECTYTGFYLRKWLNPSTPRSDVALWRTTTPWIEMRYAEMLLIRAEAAMELKSFGTDTYVSDAVTCMKAIRERAGAAKVYTANDLTIDLVRKERRMELFYENKTFWDLKRWRIFDKEVLNREMKVLWPVYVWDQKKYYMKKTTFSDFRYTFAKTLYYQKIPDGVIQQNSLIVQNPGY